MSAPAGRSPGGLSSGDGLTPQSVTRIVLRPLASSLPLGFFAFGAGSVLLTALELEWVPPAEGGVLMTMVLGFVVPLEALAGLFAFLARDVGAATGLCVLGAAWAATSITVGGAPPGSTSAALGILFTVAAMMLVPCVGSLQSKPLFGVLLLIGAARFAVTGVFQSYGLLSLEKAAALKACPPPWADQVIS